MISFHTILSFNILIFLKLGCIVQLKDYMQSCDSLPEYLPCGKTKIINKGNSIGC